MNDGRMDTELPDFQLILERVPGLYLILLPDRPRYTIVAGSDAYLSATMTRRDGPKSVIGRPMFEVFPDPPDDPGATGVTNLRASLDRAVATRTTDMMPVQHYNIRRADGIWEERHWSPRNVPILSREGRVLYLLHEVVDVTKMVKAQAAELAARAAVAAAEAALTTAREELKQERTLTYNLQQSTEQLREQGENLRMELRRLVEHSGTLRELSRRQRQDRKSGPLSRPPE